MDEPIAGIHHITAIAGNPQRNLDFYAAILGLRFVKRTVNFDDPGTYHFYFGDSTGTPGTVMTFFPWPNGRQGVRGAGQVGMTAFAVPLDALDYWIDRLNRHGVDVSPPMPRFDEKVISFADPDGTLLEIAARPAAGAFAGWEGGPVPVEHAIRGFAPPSLLLNHAGETAQLLTEIFGLVHIGQDGPRIRYAAAQNSLGVLGDMLDILVAPDMARGRNGTGVVHHIAFRAENDSIQRAWRDTLVDQGYEVTQVLDRKYFHSIYFREPGGVLFEIATDIPGFAIDEPAETLGERLCLPSWLEPQRAKIETILPPLVIPQRHEQ